MIRAKKKNNKAEKGKRDRWLGERGQGERERLCHIRKKICLKEEKEQVLYISEGRTFWAEGSAGTKALPEIV